VNMPSSSAATAAPAAAATTAPAAPSVAEREVKVTTWLVVVAILAGSFLQVWVPPGGLTLVAGAALAGIVAVALSFFAPGRLRETMAGFRFISTLLFVLAVFAMLGTLVLQGKPAAFYVERYGMVGKIVVALRFDDVFHGLPFALIIALFGASVISSTALRWPVRLKSAGFLICHLGLMTSLAGAAASTSLALRGRIDLHAGGEQATHVRVTRGGAPTGEYAQLGFDLKLDRFDLVNYEPEFRVGYYEQQRVKDERGERDTWRLLASFDPDTEKHRLPGGDSFRLKAVYPDLAAVTKAVPASAGPPALQATIGGVTQWLAPGQQLRSPDGAVTVVFAWERPAAPAGALTAVLVSGAERKVVVHRADGQAEQAYAQGLALLGGAVKLGELYEHASLTTEPGTASSEWRNPAVVAEVQQQGLPKEQLMSATRPSAFMLGPTRALVFEKRDKEVKAFISHVTARQGSATDRRSIAVNDPMTFAGWTLYQVNYNPEDPSYSGLEAVYDPGVAWVFAGFALISLGVFYMFYVEPRLKRRTAAAARA
jgi:ResB-like family